MELENPDPFYELPESLVEEMLENTENISKEISSHLKEIYSNKEAIRTKLEDKNIIKKDSEIIQSLTNPTSVGIDGSYTLNKLLSSDLVAIAAVSVEGLTPPSEKRYWEKPHHLSKILSLKHNSATTSVARAIMMTFELELAFKSPHDFVFLDGSLTTHFIYFNQALNKLKEVDKRLSDFFIQRINICIPYYKEILSSPKTDKIFVGIPKYTTKNEIVKRLSLPNFEDRGLLTPILKSGELTSPIPLQKDDGQEWHLRDLKNQDLNKMVDEIIGFINQLNVIYYKPREFSPAIRIEIPQSVSSNQNRLAILLEAVRNQCIGSGIMEPYPTYMADRMVKHLSSALPAIRKTVTQDLAKDWENEIGNVFLSMYNYRS